MKIDKYDPRQDGTAAVYFQVIIRRQKKRIGLDFSWPIKKFSEQSGCLPRSKDDVEFEVYNVVIENARKKAGEIKKDYLIRGRSMTLESFMNDYNSELSKNDFVAYIENKSFTRWNKREIVEQTYKNETSVINKLKKFSAIIPFNTFNSKWAKSFDSFLKKPPYNNDINTRWGNHKVLQTYLTSAREDDNIVFDDPYARFINRSVESDRGPLDLEETKALINFYNEWKHKPLKILRQDGVNQLDRRKGLTYGEVCILRKFLFSCSTALRDSDLKKLDEDIFRDFRMSITPHKTERWGTKIKSLPINETAKMLLLDEIEDVAKFREERSRIVRIFERYVGQSCNKGLKRIAEKVGINKNLHLHVGRYTFMSLSDEAGANHTALMKQAGIKKRETLNKYMKTNEKRIEDNVDKFNSLLDVSIKHSPHP